MPKFYPVWFKDIDFKVFIEWPWVLIPIGHLVVSSCFAVLRRLHSIRSSVTRPVFVSLVVSLVLSRLDYGNATLAGITDRLMDRLRSVLNASARLIYASRRTEHVTPLLRDLHWLRYPDRIDYKLAVLVYRCLHGLAPSYLADEFTRVSEIVSRRNLRSASTANKINIIVRETGRSVFSDFLIDCCFCLFNIQGKPPLFTDIHSNNL